MFKGMSGTSVNQVCVMKEMVNGKMEESSDLALMLRILAVLCHCNMQGDNNTFL
jgi:hypothetical protein